MAAKVTAKTGALAGARVIVGNESIIIMSARGKVIVIQATQVPQLGRAAQGVSLMRLEEGDTVAALALADPANDGHVEAAWTGNGHSE
jgi:DNA gyrase subunit A